MASCAGGTLYLIFTQVASRGLTFIGNQILLRYLSPTLLGIAVQLELVSVTIMYFARESLRTAMQRQPAASSSAAEKGEQKQELQRQSQTGVNLSYLGVGLGLIIALVSSLWYLRVADIEVLQSPHFKEAFYVYGAATMTELCAEPLFVVIQQHSLYKQRARAETSGAIARCLFACATAYIASRKGLPSSVLPFAVGQLAYSVVLFAFYFQAARQPAREQDFGLVPHTITAPSSTTRYIFSMFSRPILSLAGTMYLQSIFKLLLTQGDALILSFLSSLADQGAFALASNYGGLLARLVFQPIEESSRNTFGRLLASKADNTTSTRNVKLALSHLSTTIHTYTLLSLPLLSLAPFLIPTLAPLILSAHWHSPSTTTLLSTYIYLIPFLAVNGILDAFVTSVATPKQLRMQSLFMLGITAGYGGLCYLFLRHWGMGSEGLVWAGVGGMVGRICWGGWFVDAWIMENAGRGESGDGVGEPRKRFWRESIPDARCVCGAVLVGVWLKSSKLYGIGAEGESTGVMGRKVLPGVDLNVGDLGKLITGTVLVGSVM